MGQRLLETTFALLHLLSIVSPYCCWVEKFLSKHALADYQLSLPAFMFTFDVLWLSTCCCWASFSTVLFALYFFYCGCLLFLGWTGCSLRFSLPPFLSCLLLLLLAWKGFRRGWGQLLSAVSFFLCIPSLVLVCCCWGWQVAVFRGNSRWRGKSFLKQPCTSCVLLLLLVSGLERFLSKQALADNQLLPSSFTFTFDVLWLSTCCCWARFLTAAFALQSSSCGCLLFLGWTGCSFRDYSMRQRFFQVA